MVTSRTSRPGCRVTSGGAGRRACSDAAAAREAAPRRSATRTDGRRHQATRRRSGRAGAAPVAEDAGPMERRLAERRERVTNGRSGPGGTAGPPGLMTSEGKPRAQAYDARRQDLVETVVRRSAGVGVAIEVGVR